MYQIILIPLFQLLRSIGFYGGGAGVFGIYASVVIPLSIPGSAVVCIWQFTQIWNEFLWGITLTQQSAEPITVGLAQLAGGKAVTWNLPMAGSIIAAAPVVLIYIPW